MKILFVGNSYTYFNDLPQIFENIAKDNGKDVSALSVTCGGRKLYEYVHKDDEFTQKLDEIIKEHKFDICFLQENSTVPIRENDLFVSGAKELMGKIKPSADKFIMYETWGRKEGSEMLEELNMTNKEMTYELANEYKKVAEMINADVSYVGLNFYDVYTGNDEIDLYDPDLSHPSYEGSCLAALTHYYKVFGDFPENTKSLTLSEDVIAVFKNTVLKKLSV